MKFVAGLIIGAVVVITCQVWASDIRTYQSPMDAFLIVGGVGSDGLSHKLKVEADGGVYCHGEKQ